MIETKGVLSSKINWVGILLLIAGSADYANMLPEVFKKWVMLAAGISTLIFRTFYTNKQVSL